MAAVESTMPQVVKAGEEKKVTTEKKQANKDLQKTKLCIYNLEGKCGLGSACSFAHSPAEIKNAPDLRKTQLCAKFAEGRCFNKNCNYAHGEAELKDPPNFKKKVCKWFQKGNCRNGVNCGFAHDLEELRAPPPPGFEPIGAKVPPTERMPKKLAPPPGLSKMLPEESDASTDVPSTHSQDESDCGPMGVPAIPEEHLFRFMAGRGAAPLQQQVALMSSAIGGLQTKLASLEEQMLQKQVAEMQQQIEQLTAQCWSLENGIAAPEPRTSTSRLNAKAAPFKPVGCA